jgi:hypothetical protein
MTTFWAILPERNGAANYECFNSMLDVAMNAGMNGYKRIMTGYTRVDDCRNGIVRTFLSASNDSNDLLVMLDADHKYPMDIIHEFTEHDPVLGVVGALAYRRGEPYDPLFYIRDEKGLHAIVGEFERGPIYQCAMVSTSAISIRRRVFDELLSKGFKEPYFRYEYDENTGSCPSEDVYLSKVCELAGIKVYCDSGIEIPHATIAYVDHKTRAGYEKAHPIPSKNMEITGGTDGD